MLVTEISKYLKYQGLLDQLPFSVGGGGLTGEGSLQQSPKDIIRLDDDANDPAIITVSSNLVKLTFPLNLY